MSAPDGSEGRVVFAFFAQPIVVGLLAFALFPVIDVTGRPLYGGRPMDAMGAAISVGFGAALASVFVLLFAALPLYAWLQRRGTVTMRQTLISGAVLGNLPGALIIMLVIAGRLTRGEALGLNSLTYGFLGLIRALLLGASLGAASAAVFWWMAGGRARVSG